LKTGMIIDKVNEVFSRRDILVIDNILLSLVQISDAPH